MSQNTGISRKQEIFSQALLEGLTIVASAERAGVTNKTAHLWLKDPIFQEAHGQARKLLLDQSFTGLQIRFEKAVKALDRHIGEETHSLPKDQIEAAKTIIDKTIQIAQLTERIKDLEAALAQQEQEELYIVKFDLRKANPDEHDILRRINADIAARENNL